MPNTPFFRYAPKRQNRNYRKTVTPAESSWIACLIIKAISEWKDVRLVPALIAFLETGENAYVYGDDMGVPAVKARATLHDFTGFWFPFDVMASRRAWMAVEKLAASERYAELEKILPSEECPFKAEIFSDSSGKAVCNITNKSRHNTAIACLPDEVLQVTPMISNVQGMSDAPKSKADFVFLQPGGSTKFKSTLDPGFLKADLSVRKLKLAYYHTGSAWHMKAWVGLLEAEILTASNKK